MGKLIPRLGGPGTFSPPPHVSHQRRCWKLWAPTGGAPSPLQLALRCRAGAEGARVARLGAANRTGPLLPGVFKVQQMPADNGGCTEQG